VVQSPSFNRSGSPAFLRGFRVSVVGSLTRHQIESVRPGQIGNGTYLRHGGQPRAEGVIDWVARSSAQVEISEIVRHEAQRPMSLRWETSLSSTGGSSSPRPVGACGTRIVLPLLRSSSPSVGSPPASVKTVGFYVGSSWRGGRSSDHGEALHDRGRSGWFNACRFPPSPSRSWHRSRCFGPHLSPQAGTTVPLGVAIGESEIAGAFRHGCTSRPCSFAEPSEVTVRALIPPALLALNRSAPSALLASNSAPLYRH